MRLRGLSGARDEFHLAAIVTPPNSKRFSTAHFSTASTPFRPRAKPVLARTGLSRSTIYRKITEGTFPPQIRISVNGSGWHESDINRWIADPVAWRPKREFDVVR
jgi:prophage regulatory protein